MRVSLVRITGQPDDLALPEIEARGVLMVTEHRRGRTGKVMRNADIRRDTLFRADGVPNLLAYIATAIHPLETLDRKVDLRRGRAKKPPKRQAVMRITSD